MLHLFRKINKTECQSRIIHQGSDGFLNTGKQAEYDQCLTAEDWIQIHIPVNVNKASPYFSLETLQRPVNLTHVCTFNSTTVSFPSILRPI